MMDDEVRAMKAWLKERDRTKHPDAGRILFPSIRGTRLCRRRLHNIIRKYGGMAELPLSKQHFHVLKHTTGTLMLEKGSDIRFVQKWLGHADIRNTAIYADLTPIAIDEQSKRVSPQCANFTNDEVEDCRKSRVAEGGMSIPAD